MITIRHRAASGKRWTKREFPTEAEATEYASRLSTTGETVWEGRPEAQDPPKTPRAMWTGTIAFGMVSVPVRLYKATDGRESPLRSTCREHGGPVQQRKWCVAGGHELTAAEIGRAVEVPGGLTPISDAELNALPAGQPKTMSVDGFLPAGSVPALYQEGSYFVAPDKLGTTPYALLVAALTRTNTIGIGRVTIQQTEHLCLLRPTGDRLELVTLHWPSEMRSPERLPAGADVDPAALTMACTLIEAMSRPAFEPAAYVDVRRGELDKLIDAKAQAAGPAAADADGTIVTGLMERLAASVEANKRAAPPRPRRNAK